VTAARRRVPAPTVVEGPGRDFQGRRTWTMRLPFTKPLSLNQTVGVNRWRARDRTKPWRDTGIVFVQRYRVRGLGRFTVVLHHAPRTGHEKLDLSNYEGGLKPLVDGMVHAGLCVDDNANRYLPTDPVIHEPTREPGRLWVVVTDLTYPGPHPHLPGPRDPGASPTPLS
jgi:hypothetical protein